MAGAVPNKPNKRTPPKPTNTLCASASRRKALLIAASGGVLGLVIARFALHDGAIRIAMSAFRLEADAQSVLVGFGGVLLLGLFGTAPAILRVQRLSIASALKEP